MSTEITKFSQIPITEIMSIGKAFVESGMFPDVKSAAQAVVKIQAGQEIGIAPFAAMTGIHIIQGRPTIGAGLIASKVKASGKYDYKVIEMTDKNCSIEFYEGKNKLGISSFSIDEARKAGTKNLDKFPKNMLFARAISNGVKWFTPDVFSGPVYTPEEMITEDVAAVVTTEKKKEVENTDDYLKYWEDELNKCKSKTELLVLWNSNATSIKDDNKVKAMFKTREIELTKTATA